MLDSEEEFEKQTDGQSASVCHHATRCGGRKGHLFSQEGAGILHQLFIPLPITTNTAKALISFSWIRCIRLKSSRTQVGKLWLWECTPLPANKLVTCCYGDNSGRGHSTITESNNLHCIGPLLEEHIHPTGNDGDVILFAKWLFKGWAILALINKKRTYKQAYFLQIYVFV